MLDYKRTSVGLFDWKEFELSRLQAKIVIACKAIRAFYVVLQTGCDFDEEKFRRDIIRPEAV